MKINVAVYVDITRNGSTTTGRLMFNDQMIYEWEGLGPDRDPTQVMVSTLRDFAASTNGAFL